MIQEQFGILWCPCGRGNTREEWKAKDNKCDLCGRVHLIKREGTLIIPQSVSTRVTGKILYNGRWYIVLRQVHKSSVPSYLRSLGANFYYEVEPVGQTNQEPNQPSAQ